MKNNQETIKYQGEVEKFNALCGKDPATHLEPLLLQIGMQAELVVEEAKETEEDSQRAYDMLLDGASPRDVLEKVVDGCADVLFTAAQIVVYLESAGVDVQGALLAVCENNLLKFTQDYEQAQDWLQQIQKRIGDAFVRTSIFQGETYYCVVNTNGKVMKWDGFPCVDLKEFIELKESVRV